MKKLKLIYNPNSGDRQFKNELDIVIFHLQKAGYIVEIFRTIQNGDIEKHISSMENDYEVIVVSGGDGTINIVLNAMIKYGIDAKLGIIPSGTANDFASFLGIPKDTEQAAEIIAKGKSLCCDFGQVNDKYFINVCAAGLLTNVSQLVDENIKSSFGKFAYYLKGIEQIPNFMPLKMKITNSTETIIDDLYFFIILNSSGTGGFSKLSKDAKIDDGLFDFIGFKAVNVIELAVIFVKLVTGDYLDDDNIIFFRDSEISVEYLDEVKKDLDLQSDTDGELGPKMPLKIINIPKGIEIFTP